MHPSPVTPQRPFPWPALPALRRWRAPAVGVDTLIVGFSLYGALAGNRLFFDAALAGRSATDPSTWGFALALLLLLLSLNVLLLAPLATRLTVKPLLAVLTVATALAVHFMGRYGVYLDPSMLRNVLRTDLAEARELLGGSLLSDLLWGAGPPLAVLWHVRVVRQRPWRAAGRRALLAGTAAAVFVLTLWSVFQPMASLMRNQKDLRYRVTPANLLWSLGAVAVADARGAAQPRQPIGLDAAPGPSWATRQRPLVVVLVVGETARAADWGLSGAARPTTPALSALPVVAFPDVSACGTSTEVSLPCMFAPVGRRDYDEATIRRQESLLQVLARAGVGVHWRDNQSGCKGVCDGLPNDRVDTLQPPGACADGRCLDEGLTQDLTARLQRAQGTQLWVLHMLGNHGPSYFRRYPPAFARFQPECRDDDLHRCSVEAVRNAYDNALLYTDHVLAGAIAQLQAQAGSVDSVLLYVSDHGESLGEHGLFLHGLPWAIAPDTQKKVPMLMWASAGVEAAAGLVPGCLRPTLRQQAARPLAHDHLFHTLLGLLDVRTSLYAPDYDLVHGCRDGGAAS